MQSAYGLGGGWDWKEMAKEFMGGIGIENDMRERVWVDSGTKNNMRSVYGRGLKKTVTMSWVVLGLKTTCEVRMD
jgi:hypothetical protein